MFSKVFHEDTLCQGIFSVAKATLESQMSVILSVCNQLLKMTYLTAYDI